MTVTAALKIKFEKLIPFLSENQEMPSPDGPGAVSAPQLNKAFSFIIPPGVDLAKLHPLNVKATLKRFSSAN